MNGMERAAINAIVLRVGGYASLAALDGAAVTSLVAAGWVEVWERAGVVTLTPLGAEREGVELVESTDEGEPRWEEIKRRRGPIRCRAERGARQLPDWWWSRLAAPTEKRDGPEPILDEWSGRPVELFGGRVTLYRAGTWHEAEVSKQGGNGALKGGVG